MDTTHFVFDTNIMIQRVRVCDMRVNVSYAMSCQTMKWEPLDVTLLTS